MTSLNRKLIRDLLHMRGQVFAIILVVGSGVAAFVALRSIYESLIVTQAAYYNEYRFAHVFAQARRARLALTPRLSSTPAIAYMLCRPTVSY
ncbi:MAG: hypothetical protein ACKV2V_17320 [Blastocatellia bacterium]